MTNDDDDDDDGDGDFVFEQEAFRKSSHMKIIPHPLLLFPQKSAISLVLTDLSYKAAWCPAVRCATWHSKGILEHYLLVSARAAISSFFSPSSSLSQRISLQNCHRTQRYATRSAAPPHIVCGELDDTRRWWSQAAMGWNIA